MTDASAELAELEARARRLCEQSAVDRVVSHHLALVRDLIVHLRTRGDDTERSLRERLSMALDREAALKRDLATATIRIDNEVAARKLVEKELEKAERANLQPPGGVCSACGVAGVALTCWECAREKHRVAAGGEA